MAVERQNRGQLEVAPKWWHEALKKHFVGNQTDEYSFQCAQSVSPSGIHYILHSRDSNGFNTNGYQEGIFIQMLVPDDRLLELDEIVKEIAYPFALALRIFQETNRSSNEAIDLLDPNPDFLGQVTKLERQRAIGADYLDSSKDRAPEGYTSYRISLHLADDETVKNEAMKQMKDNYFLNAEFLERISVLATNKNTGLKVEILKLQAEIDKKAIDKLAEQGLVSKYLLAAIAGDPLVADSYGRLMNHLIFSESEAEHQILKSLYHTLDPLMKAGFHQYVLKYWSQKLGIYLENLYS